MIDLGLLPKLLEPLNLLLLLLSTLAKKRLFRAVDYFFDLEQVDHGVRHADFELAVQLFL
jgi:hypothetical protein